MPYFSLPDSSLYLSLLVLFLLASLMLVVAYIRERRYRRRPYFRFKNEKEPHNLEDFPKPLYSVALVGDIGDITDATQHPVTVLLKKWMDRQREAGAIVLLGDNIYPIGLPPESHWRFPASEQKLLTQVELFKQHAGRVIYLSGNHDWNKARPNGFSYMLRQQHFIQSLLQKPDCYLPADGCPGPVSLSLAPGLRLIVINTQWWVQRGTRPIGKAFNCTVESVEEFFERFKAMLEEHRQEQIIIAAHHPLYSNALHGGKFTLKHHLFPLTAAHKKFYIPLPVAGSLYPAYRKFFGAYEDMSHPRYRRLRKRLLKILRHYENVIYVAGHDHNLQYFPIMGNHFVVSGSGSKTAFVRKGGRADFAHEHHGFFVVDYYPNQEVWLRVLEPVQPPAVPKEVVFSRRLS
ncbi:MAG: metallophosphoesterase [Adhaeribacter sp.]